MRTFKLDKLVRDKIADLTEQAGGKVNYKVLNDKDYLLALRDKILEEAAEN